jgi:hypothetical protein
MAFGVFFCAERERLMHVIRLRRPWQRCCDWTADERVDVPDEEPFAAESDPRGTSVCYRRSFNRPTGLESHTTVVLRVSRWTGKITSLIFNGTPVTTSGFPLEVDLSRWIEPHNTIELTLESENEQTPRLNGEVSLNIAEHDGAAQISSTV